jgi:hypothetical protein
MEYLFLGLELFILWSTFGPELFVTWSTFGPCIIYSMEYLWSLNYFQEYLWALNYLVYGVPLGPELFILWSTFGPCPGPCWRGSGAQRWTPGCRTAPWWGSLGTRAHLHQPIYTLFVMTNMNFTIASNLDPPIVLVEARIGPSGE